MTWPLLSLGKCFPGRKLSWFRRLLIHSLVLSLLGGFAPLFSPVEANPVQNKEQGGSHPTNVRRSTGPPVPVPVPVRAPVRLQDRSVPQVKGSLTGAHTKEAKRKRSPAPNEHFNGISLVEEDNPLSISYPETMLLRGFEAIRNGDIDSALSIFEILTRVQPDFRLAHLIYGDLLLARGGQLKNFGQIPVKYRKNLAPLLSEARARARLLHERPPKGSLPASLLHLGREYSHAIVVDLSRSRLYLFQNRDGEPLPLADYYASIGKRGPFKVKRGDKKTPVGLYFVTGFVGPDKLPDYYGEGALTLDYPNQWDKRFNRTGSGIWIHGNPKNTYSRPPLASDGCVTLANEDFLKLMGHRAEQGTPVVITHSVQWLAKPEWQRRRRSLMGQLMLWYMDWVSGDRARILTHYSPLFRSSKLDLQGWSRLIGNQVQHMKREPVLREVTLLGYPDQDRKSMVMAIFMEGKRRRRQLWRLEQEEKVPWRIVFEDIR